MSRIKIVAALIRYLWQNQSHSVKYTINRRADGQTWFLVEPAFVMIPGNKLFDPYVDIDGKRYVKVGRGLSASYLYVGDAGCPLGNASEDQEPNVG
jgi:hypothetical protein